VSSRTQSWVAPNTYRDCNFNGVTPETEETPDD
jgi:hypothetical protein